MKSNKIKAILLAVSTGLIVGGFLILASIGEPSNQKVIINPPPPWQCGDEVAFTYRGEEVIYGTVYNPTTTECWMDRNLGASQVATGTTDSLAYGDLFQWGRLDDGHQTRTSATTSTNSSGDVPGHGDFILEPDSSYDWRISQNNNLWQPATNTNNPCPSGWHLPTETEWETERLSWSTDNAAGAFNSPLKLPIAGRRNHSTGSLSNVGTNGYYWSSAVSDIDARGLGFSSTDAGMHSYSRATGNAVRCILDDLDNYNYKNENDNVQRTIIDSNLPGKTIIKQE